MKWNIDSYIWLVVCNVGLICLNEIINIIKGVKMINNLSIG